MPTTKTITVVVPPSLTPQEVTIEVAVPDPIVVDRTPIVTPGVFSETHTITGTTPPP